jgi:hypothetical protein
MKKIIKICIVIVAILMLVGTSMIFLKDIKILFTSESADYLSSISEPNRLLSILFFIGFSSMTIFIFRDYNKIKLIILFLLLGLWLLSGRIIAIKEFPDGRIITGWYYIQTNSYFLCGNDSDCETTLAKESTITKLPLWRINIKNKHTNKVIFVGPFVWHSIILPIFETERLGC